LTHSKYKISDIDIKTIDCHHSRPDYHHVAICHCTHSHQEVGEWHAELEPPNGPLAVVVAIEEDRVLSIALGEKSTGLRCKRNYAGWQGIYTILFKSL